MDGHEGKLLRLSLLNRVVVFVLGHFIDSVCQDYDLSSPRYSFLKWDAVYFVAIAKRGYLVENELAFYPGFPILIRAVSAVTRLSCELVSLVLPSIFYVLSSIVLYRLTTRVFNSSEFAYRTSLFWCISPISVFSFAPYTESLFAFCSFLGMLTWLQSKLFFTVICFVSAAAVRSNGVFLSGFFCWSFLSHVFPISGRASGIFASFFRSFADFKPNFRFGLIGLASICFAPSAVFAFFANSKFCPGCEWCGSSHYGYVQTKYWNVGFLTYWSIRQIPNLMLAVPITVVVVAYCWAQRRSKNVLLLAFLFHALFLLFVSLFWANVQVTTRVVLAGSPAGWWALAASNRTLAVVFCVSYGVIGVCLFVNFLPWT
jgi:phosphatidylinositol glycan class V